MMGQIGGLTLIALLASMISCSSVYDVDYHYDRLTPFPPLQTYDWQTFTSTDESTAELVKDAVNNRLSAKGFRMTTDNPDFLIMAHVAKQEKSRFERWDYQYYNAPYWGQASDYQYAEATLILDIMSAQSEKLLWRGSATADLDAVVNPEAKKELINTAVEKILAQFPPAKAP